MTTATEAVRLAGLDMRALSDDALGAMYADGQQPLSGAAMAEAQRRDRAATRRRKAGDRRAAAESEWMDAAHAHYLAAEAQCCGNLTARGSWVGEPFPGLYHLSDRDFDRQASEEMRNFAGSNPRPARQDFIRAAFAPRKGANPWHEPGWEAVKMDETTGGLAEFAPAEAGVSAQPRTGPATGEQECPATSGDSGAAERRAARAVAAEAVKARAATAYTPPRRPAQVYATPGYVTPAAQPEAGGDVAVIEPAAVMAPGRAVPDARQLLPELANELACLLTDQVYFSTRAAAIAVTVWILHAAARDQDKALIWRASPRLLLTSRQNGSGKSTLLDLIALLLKSQAGRLVKVTPYGLTKLLNEYHDVGLPDDAQNIFGSTGEAAKELQSVLLGSYSRGGSWMSGKKNGSLEKVYGPVAIAGKDKLIIQQARALEDLLARSVIIRMERPPRYMPELDEDTEDRARVLAEVIEGVMGSLTVDLLDAARQIAREVRGTEIIDGDGGRIAQIGRPLLAVGRVIGPPWDGAVEQSLRELMSAAGDLISAEAALASLRGERAQREQAGGSGRNFWDHDDGRGW